MEFIFSLYLCCDWGNQTQAGETSTFTHLDITPAIIDVKMIMLKAQLSPQKDQDIVYSGTKFE